MAVIGWACVVLGQGTFLSPVSIGPNINAVKRAVVVDVDGDGEREMVLSSTGVGQTIALGLTGGEVTSFKRLVQDDGNSDVGMVADLNADGYPEIIRSGLDHLYAGLPTSIFVYWGGPEGTYGEPTITHEGNDCVPRLIADITGDSIPELIGTSGSGTIEIYHFVPDEGELRLFRSLAIGGYWFYLTVADIDDDGIGDLIFAPNNSYSGQVRAWFASNGPDSPTTVLSTFTEWIGELSAADIDQDGLLDLFAGSSSSQGQHFFDVWLNQGGGSFDHHEDLNFGAWFYDHALTDLDDDNIVDMVYAYDKRLYRSRILPDLSIAPPDTLVETSSPIESFSMDDANGDGWKDLLIIGTDARLSSSNGTDDPLDFAAPMQLFKWNKPVVAGMALYEANGISAPELAFVSREDEFEVDLLEMDRPDNVPLIYDVQLGTGYWSYTNGASLLVEDLDGDGDKDLLGCQSSDSYFNPCQLFAIEAQDGVFIDHCFGASLASIQSYSSLESVAVDLFDVTGDGMSDIVVSGNWDELGSQQTWISATQVLERTTPFTAQSTTTTLPPAAYFGHRDVDQDGDEDLLENNVPGNEIIIKYNNGFGQFPTTNSWPWDFSVRGGGYWWADVDGDGLDEACWMRLEGLVVRCYSQTFTSDSIGVEQLIFERTFPEEYPSMQLIDMDGDADADLLFRCRKTDGTYDWVLEYHENTDGLMGDQGEVLFIDRWFSNLATDVDSDGDLDMVINRYARLHLLRNTTDPVLDPEDPPSTSGTFQLYPNPAVGSEFTLDLGLLPSSDISVSIIDGTGRLVQSSSANSAIISIPTTSLANGYYVIRAWDPTTGKNIGTARLSVLRSM